MADKLRENLRRDIEAAGLTPAQVSRAIGRSKDYVRDYLTRRKDDISRTDWAKISEVLAKERDAPRSASRPPSNAGATVDQADVLIVLEALLRRSGMNDNAANEAAAEFLEALLDRQEPAPDRRSDALRAVVRHIARRILP